MSASKAVVSDFPVNVVCADGEGTQDGTHGPVRQDILDAVEKILSSSGFDATERSRRLLRYLVDEALAGRTARIKAYSIGTEVLGRPSSFDPQKDPIVRIEAARLRRDLEHYYLTDGRDDPLMIVIPKGAYVPQFQLTRGEGGPPPVAAASGQPAEPTDPLRAKSVMALLGMLILLSSVGLYAWSAKPPVETVDRLVHIPGLIIKPLADLSRTSQSALMAEGLSERIVEKTSRFKELAVIAANATATPATEVRYEFGGSLRLVEQRVLVQVRLADRLDGRVIWADSFDMALLPQQFSDTETRIADQIAARIAAPSGVVFESERHAQLERPPEHWDAYLCTLRAYAYRASFSGVQFPEMRHCLEQAVDEQPDYATAWALLSLAYLDEIRYFYPPPAGNSPPAIERAYASARHAVDIDPSNLRAQQALMMTLFFRENYDEAIDIGEKALALNPNDVEFKGEFGFRLALSGNWDRGCGFLQQALDSSARKIAYYKTGLAICAYMKHDLKAATKLITEADAMDNPAYHTIADAIFGEIGEAEAAAKNRSWLLANVPQKVPLLVSTIPERLLRAEDRERFRNSLRKAGLFAGG